MNHSNSEGSVTKTRDVAKRVIEIVSHWSNSQDINCNTDLWVDARIEGDDVGDLFTELVKEFGPLPLDRIRWEQHFEMNEPPFFFDLLGRRRKRFETERVPMRVHHIVRWIETKQWPIEYLAAKYPIVTSGR